MNKTPRHDNTSIQAISLAFHHIDLSDTLFLSTEHSAATQQSPPTLSRYG